MDFSDSYVGRTTRVCVCLCLVFPIFVAEECMSLFDDAEAFMKNKKSVSAVDEQRESLIKKLRAEFGRNPD